MKMAIIGGGNIGTLIAGEFLHKGHKTFIYTSKPKLWSDSINVCNAQGEILFNEKISCVTNDLKIVINNADIIWITLPAFAFNDIAKKLEPLVTKNQYIGIIPGGGGSDSAFSSIIKKGCTLFGFERVHSIARLNKYGESVLMLGRKTNIKIACEPTYNTQKICDIVSNLFDMPTSPLPNYLSVTLTPSNSLLHTTRIYTMFKDYKKGIFYPRNFLFYEEWNDETSKLLLACDDELQQLCNIIPLDLSSVKSLKEHYESYSVEAMTKKIRSIPAFSGLLSPMKKTNALWVPDFESRYFTADFPFGLKIIIDIALKYNFTPKNMLSIWNWFLKVKN